LSWPPRLFRFVLASSKLVCNLAIFLKIGIRYGFSRVINRLVIAVKKKVVFFFCVAHAILLLPPSLQTFFTNSTMLWERLFQKLNFQLYEKYVFLN